MSQLRTSFAQAWASGRQFGALCLMLASGLPMPGQEAIRMSQASQEAAQARTEAAGMYKNANLRLGPTAWLLSTTLGLEGRDNVNLSESDPEADLAVKPQINTRLWLPITEKNSFNLSLGVGYKKYMRLNDSGDIFITPGSELSFDLFVGDVVLNLHDRFTIQSDAQENPTLTGTRTYQRLENVAGLRADWDMNRIRLTAGYDHSDHISLKSLAGQSDAQAESFYARAGYRTAPTTLAGLEGGVSLVDFAESQYRDALQYNGGVFWEGKLTDYISAKASAGYTIYAPFGSGDFGQTTDKATPYAELALTHRLNQFLTHTLSGGKSFNTGVRWGNAGQVWDTYQVRWQGNWKLVDQLAISTPLYFQHQTGSGTFAEKFYYYGGGITVGRQLMSKLYGSVGYNLSRRESDFGGRSYWLNMVTVNVTYKF